MLVSLNEVLTKAQKGGYAVGLFNTINMEMLDAAIEAAEEEKSPIIIGTAEVLLPYGELDLIAPSIIAKAKAASVPVVVHFDHGLTFKRVMQAIKLGFSSVMYDCSALNMEDNIAATREVVKIAHSFGVSVEAEIGHIGGSEDEAASDVDESGYTTVEDAHNFEKNTGIDALAVAIGTAHGSYKKAPVLDLERLSAIKSKVNAPLVLHGGSGLTDSDFKNAIKSGISKINIFTDLTIVGANAIKDGLAQNKNYLQIRNMQKDYIKAEIIKKMRLFGSNNKE